MVKKRSETYLGIRSLGEPLTIAGMFVAALGKYQGKSQIYAVSSGKTCAMYVIDLETGECLKKLDLEGSSHTWGIYVYHVQQKRWVGKYEHTSKVISPADENGNVYLLQEGKLCSLNISTQDIEETNIACETSIHMDWIDLKNDEFTGKVLVIVEAESYLIYDPRTKKYKKIEVKLPGIPVSIRTLLTGSDGKIYMGGYFRGGFTTYDPMLGLFSECVSFGQTEGVAEYNKKLYLGVYPFARIYCYDMSKPWHHNINPELKFTLRDHDQDRPFAMIDAGRCLAIGTVPNYGTLGGALTLYDDTNDTHEVYTNLVDHQSIICFTESQGMLFGGTSIWGRLGIQPIETEGKLFMFDLYEKKKIWEGTPIARDTAISGLCTDSEGMIWGLTPSSIFKFDPSKKVVVHSQ